MLRPSLSLALATAAVLAALSGCASSRILRIAGENSSGFSYDADGTVVLRSEKSHNVAVRIARERGSAEAVAMPALTIYVTNGGTKPMMVGPEDISAVTGDNQPVPVLGRVDTAARLQREIPTVGSSSMGAATRDAAAPIYNDPHPSPEKSSSPSTTSSHSHSTPMPGSDTRFDKLLEPLLVRSSIAPGQTAGGIVKLDPTNVAPGAPERLSVTVDGERHDFLFTVQ